MIKVGKVSYLNTMPLFYKCDGSETVLVEGHPSELVDRLRKGEIKAGIVSSVEYLPHEEREKPLIIEEELVIEKPMSVEDAIFELQSSGKYFLPFVDIVTGTLKIAYRKRGGNFGVINTKCKGM